MIAKDKKGWSGLFQIKYLWGFLKGVGVDGFLFESRA